MQESFEYFSHLIRHHSLQKLPFILLLNKVDALEAKMKEIPVSEKFPDCPEKVDCMEVCEFFSQKFKSLDKRREGELKIYVTSAADPTLFKETLQTISPILTRNGKRNSPPSEGFIEDSAS